MVCMCVFSYMRDKEVKPLEHFDILTEVWNHIVAVAAVGSHDAVQKAVAVPDNHPQPSVALSHLHSIYQPPRIVCSGAVESAHQGT